MSIQSERSTATRLRLLVVTDSSDVPACVRQVITRQDLQPVYAGLRRACEAGVIAKADMVVICGPTTNNVSANDLRLLADALVSHRLVGIVLSPGTSGVVPGDEVAFIHVQEDISGEELWGRLATIHAMRPLFDEMDEQVAGMQRLGKKLNQQFVEVDQELRLASRLQRDFLPKALPTGDDVHFATLYRPASWVSGDVYDIQRLDEHRLGFYLADAVGHGVAAGLLTVFIKQAVVGKRIHDHGYTIVPPSEVLESLNALLAEQELPNCQFVTACYGVIDTQAGELTFARGGHPHPIHVGADGNCSEVRTSGGLLGIFQEEIYPSVRIALQPGEKFIVYSDGLEDLIFSREHSPGQLVFNPLFQTLVRLPLDEFAAALTDCIDSTEGSLEPKDDMTLLAIERRPADRR